MIVVVGSVELGPATRFRTRRHFRPFWSRASDLRPGPGCRTLPSFAPSVLADAPPGCRRRITHGGVGKAWPRGTGPLRRRGGQRTGRSLDGYGKRVESRGTGCDPARIQRIRSGTPAPIGGSGDADRHGHRQGFRRRPDSRIGLRSGRLPGQTVQFRRIVAARIRALSRRGFSNDHRPCRSAICGSTRHRGRSSGARSNSTCHRGVLTPGALHGESWSRAHEDSDYRATVGLRV